MKQDNLYSGYIKSCTYGVENGKEYMDVTVIFDDCSIPMLTFKSPYIDNMLLLAYSNFMKILCELSGKKGEYKIQNIYFFKNDIRNFFKRCERNDKRYRLIKEEVSKQRRKRLPTFWNGLEAW